MGETPQEALLPPLPDPLPLSRPLTSCSSLERASASCSTFASAPSSSSAILSSSRRIVMSWLEQKEKSQAYGSHAFVHMCRARHKLLDRYPLARHDVVDCRHAEKEQARAEVNTTANSEHDTHGVRLNVPDS